MDTCSFIHLSNNPSNKDISFFFYFGIWQHQVKTSNRLGAVSITVKSCVSSQWSLISLSDHSCLCKRKKKKLLKNWQKSSILNFSLPWLSVTTACIVHWSVLIAFPSCTWANSERALFHISKISQQVFMPTLSRCGLIKMCSFQSIKALSPGADFGAGECIGWLAISFKVHLTPKIFFR